MLFFRNSRYVFQEWRENRKWFIAPMKMYLAHTVSVILLNNALLCLYITILGISVYIAPVLLLILCVPVISVMNRYRRVLR